MRDTTTALAVLFLVTLPWMGVSELSMFGLRVIPADLVFMPLALLVVVERIRARALPDRRTLAFAAACLLYGAVHVVAALLSHAPEASLKKAVAACALPAIGIICALIVDDLARCHALMRAWRVALALVLVYAAIGLVAVAFDGPHFFARAFTDYTGSLPSGNYRRAIATFANYNMLATYLTASACVVFALRSDENRHVTTVLLVATAALAFATLSPSLGGFVLAATLLVVGARGQKCVWSRVVHVAGAGMAMLAFVSTWISPRALFDGEGPLASPRVLTWQAAFDAWTSSAKSFLVGNGPGLEHFEVRTLVAAGFEARLTDAHQIWLSLGAQTGLVGIGALALVLAAALRGTRDVVARTREGRALVVAVGVLWFYDGLTGSFEDTRHFWVLLGLLAGLRSAQLRSAVRPRE